MDATTTQGLPPIPPQLFSSVARQLYDSNPTLPPKKRFRGLSTLLPQKLESKKTKKTKRKPSPSPSEETENKEKKPPIRLREERPMAEALAEKIRGMGGERVQLVIQKQLQETDISVEHSRLSIPSTKTKNKMEFLSETEKEILSQNVPNSKRMRGIEVLVIDPRLEERKLCLKRWKMSNNFICNLTEKWNDLVKENTLEAGDTIQLWAFRVEERGRRGLSDLCFALVKLEQDNNNGDAAVIDSSTSTITAHHSRSRLKTFSGCRILTNNSDSSSESSALLCL